MNRFSKHGALLASASIASLTLILPCQGVAAAQVGPQAASPSASDGDSGSAGEIIVTAQKKSEQLYKVPIAVAVVSPENLVNTGVLRLQDWSVSVPGLSVIENGSQQYIALRGISSPGTNPTVGVLLNDAPLGASQGTGATFIPDLDPSDLAQIEVLRGPQGTLYGASAMGGVIKYVPAEPSTSGVFGKLMAGVTGVDGGSGLGYNFRASINLPVSQTFAIRVSGFERVDAGYIDNPLLNKKGVNRTRNVGGLVSALWKPSDDWSVEATALVQNYKGAAANEIDVNLPGSHLQQSKPYGAGKFDTTIQNYSLAIKGKVGNVDLVSTTSFANYHVNTSQDLSTNFGRLANRLIPQPGITNPGVPETLVDPLHKISQEIRLSGSLTSNLDWLAGVFYTHEKAEFRGDLYVENPTTGAVAGTLLQLQGPTTLREIAGFGDLTYHFNSDFSLQAGVRRSSIRIRYSQNDFGMLVPLLFPGSTSPLIGVVKHSKDDPVTFLVTPKYQITPNLMVYARVASGYRPGGPNNNPGVPDSFGSDSLIDYEIGTKGKAFDGFLLFDASVYYIDWKKIQLSLFDPQAQEAYTGNAGRAKSEGVELSLSTKPISGFTLSGWAAYDKAVLTRGFPSTSTVLGVRGDKLPFVSPWSASIDLDKTFDLGDGLTGGLGFSLQYVGERRGLFTARARQFYPSYTKKDLRASLSYEDWKLSAFAANITNTRGLTGGGIGFSPVTEFQYIQPRSVGVELTRKF